ncbi:MAG TPA: Crp/Fnr family transcriptional regulator [Thermoleophilaceae bacterium]|nr:Crp/Fnr family transcriptional regulator [Thermoleophilaceae bacterium]
MAATQRDPPQSFLSELTDREERDLRGRAVSRRFRRGATLVHQGEAPGRVLVIEAGRAKVTAITDDGREIVLAFAGPGDLLGELSALSGSPRAATVRALEPLSALAIARGDFETFLDANPRVALVILRVVIARLHDADRQQVEFAAYQTVTRVARRLVELAQRHGEQTGAAIRITLPISQEELAGWAGASREAITKALHDLRAMGLIETHRRHITVLDAEQLGQMAGVARYS